jgi:phage shock protein A
MTTESIFIRVQRVLSGSVETATGALERVSSTSLMREAIRQVGRAQDEARVELDAIRARRIHAERQRESLKERLATLQEQASFALSKNRPDLAQAAISRQIEFEAELERLKKVAADAAAEGARLEECAQQLKVRKAQMEQELHVFQATQREANICGAGVNSPVDRTESRVSRAEAAFERAMAAGGGVTTNLMNREHAAKIAEVEALQREAAIEARLAALRAEQKPASAPAAQPRKAAGKGGRGR